MTLMQTPTVQSGWPAADFRLKGIDGKIWTLADARKDKGLVIAFICNHCPYVKAIADRLAADARELQKNGIGVIAVMPNDPQSHPEDSFDNMQAFAKKHGFDFPYVIDETQETARTYGAVCTPDFFGFNKDLTLCYRGRLDAVNPSNPATPDTKRELLSAMLAMADGKEPPAEQAPSMGCSIKWRGQAA